MVEGGRGAVVGTMRGGCLLAVGARRARGSNKLVQFLILSRLFTDILRAREAVSVAEDV